MRGKARLCRGRRQLRGPGRVGTLRDTRRVTILVRGASLAASMSLYLRDEIDAAAHVEVRYRTQVVGGGGKSRLDHLVLRDLDAEIDETVEAGAFPAHRRAATSTDWLPDGVAHDKRVMSCRQRPRARATRRAGPPNRGAGALRDERARVFAVGDVRARSVKRVASAVGEGSVVIQQVGTYISTGSV